MKIEIDTSKDWVCDFVAEIMEADIKMLKKLVRKEKKDKDKSALHMEDYLNNLKHLENLKEALKFYTPASYK